MASLTSLAAKWNLEEYALYRVFICKLDFSVSPFLHLNYCIAFQLCTLFLPCTTTPITTLIGLTLVKLRPRAAPPVGQLVSVTRGPNQSSRRRDCLVCLGCMGL